MTKITLPKRRRGRPPNGSNAPAETRLAIIQAGLELLTEKGAAATGIDQVLKHVGIPKGSFYHYFANKEAFLRAVVNAYRSFFAHKLEKHFSNVSLPPLQRVEAFMADARASMEKYQFRRGCLIGNLGQEVETLSDAMRADIENVLIDWEQRLASCLRAAIDAGELPEETDCDAAASFFWTGWEGAVMRAKLRRDTTPMVLFGESFINLLRPVQGLLSKCM